MNLITGETTLIKIQVTLWSKWPYKPQSGGSCCHGELPTWIQERRQIPRIFKPKWGSDL